MMNNAVPPKMRICWSVSRPMGLTQSLIELNTESDQKVVFVELLVGSTA